MRAKSRADAVALMVSDKAERLDCLVLTFDLSQNEVGGYILGSCRAQLNRVR